MKLALAATLVVACGRPAPAPSSTEAPRFTELVVGVVDDWRSTRATLAHYRFQDGWTRVGEPWDAVVGRTGVAWGIGHHGDGAPPGHDGPVKREGDGKSPAGIFALRGAYGYAPRPPAPTPRAYTALGPEHACVDDPASAHYDQILDARAVTPDWRSAEVMRRDDALYTWVLDVAHNPAHTPRAGSCIFLHVWGGPGTTTAGCTAMSEDRLAALIATLGPEAAFVLLPRDAYARLQGTWHLPPP